MLYFHITDEGRCDQITAEYPFKGVAGRIADAGWVARHEIKDLAHADTVAQAATDFAGKLYVAVDSGPCVSPRYDVIEAPKVGDAVSYGFNGDYYPDGEIVSITKGTLRVIKTSTGSAYYRRGVSGRWVKKGGTWSLVQGHHSDKNPSF